MKSLATFSKERSISKTVSRVSKIILKELIPSGTPSLKKSSKKNTTISFSKKRCFGIKNQEKSRLSLGIKTPLSSILKLKLEEREIRFIDFNSLVVLGPLIATHSNMKLKIISRIFSVEANPPMTDPSLKATTFPLMSREKFL